MLAMQDVPLGTLKASIYGSPAIARQKSTATNRLPSLRKPASDDALLIERLKAGDSDALETIFNTYSNKLYHVALRILLGELTQGAVREPKPAIGAWRRYGSALMAESNSERNKCGESTNANKAR